MGIPYEYHAYSDEHDLGRDHCTKCSHLADECVCPVDHDMFRIRLLPGRPEPLPRVTVPGHCFLVHGEHGLTIGSIHGRPGSYRAVATRFGLYSEPRVSLHESIQSADAWVRENGEYASHLD